MKTIVVRNRKGGVGKTTLTVTLASGLALQGYRVAIVDTDSQGHAAKAVGLSKEDGLYRLLVDGVAMSDVLRRVPPERYTSPNLADKPSYLVVLPSDSATSLIPLKQQDPFIFRDTLLNMGEWLELDFVVVDTGPTASLFDGAVNFAADYYLYVTEIAELSFDGLAESIHEMEATNRRYSRYRTWDTEIMGIVPNKARFSTLAHREKVAELMQAFPNKVWNPIKLGVVWEECANFGQAVFSYAPDSQEAQHGWNLVNRALEVMNVPSRS